MEGSTAPPRAMLRIVRNERSPHSPIGGCGGGEGGGGGVAGTEEEEMTEEAFGVRVGVRKFPLTFSNSGL